MKNFSLIQVFNTNACTSFTIFMEEFTVLCPFWQATCSAVCPIASSTSTSLTCCTRSWRSSVRPFTASQCICEAISLLTFMQWRFLKSQYTKITISLLSTIFKEHCKSFFPAFKWEKTNGSRRWLYHEVLQNSRTEGLKKNILDLDHQILCFLDDASL